MIKVPLEHNIRYADTEHNNNQYLSMFSNTSDYCHYFMVFVHIFNVIHPLRINYNKIKIEWETLQREKEGKRRDDE